MWLILKWKIVSEEFISIKQYNSSSKCPYALMNCCYAVLKRRTSSRILFEVNDVIRIVPCSSYHESLIDWLIDLGLTPFLTILKSYHGDQFTYSCVHGSHTSTPHIILSKQLATCPHILLNSSLDAGHSDSCQTSERMLAELGIELTTPGLTARVATDCATAARLITNL